MVKRKNKWVIYIDDKLRAQVKLRALKEEMSVGEWINKLIRKALGL